MSNSSRLIDSALRRSLSMNRSVERDDCIEAIAVLQVGDPACTLGHINLDRDRNIVALREQPDQ
jgi:hypothetical protein